MDNFHQQYLKLLPSTIISFAMQFIFQKGMTMPSIKPRLQLLKEWIFQFLFILDTHQFTNSYAQVLGIVMELTMLHYFYINPIFTFLGTHRVFQSYFQNLRPYLIHIYAFSSTIMSLLTLTLYPLVIALVIFIKKFGPNKLLIPIMQVAVFVYPLVWVKVVIELVNALRMGLYLYLVLPLGVLNILFAAVLLMLTGRPLRLMEFPLVMMLELGANIFAIIIMLLVRLGILGYLLRKANRNSVKLFYQIALMAVLVTSPFCDDQLLNTFAFLIVVLACLAFGFHQTRRAMQQENSILTFADLLEQEDEEQAVFQVYDRVEQHHVTCDLPDCLCQDFYSVEKEKLTEWVYRFEEQRLRRSESLQGRLQYAARCWSHYDFKLNGLVRVCQGKPKGVMWQYRVFKACCIYQLNLRKQDKNYRYGQPFRNSQEELQAFHLRLGRILAEIRKFWQLITRFDGSTKFLNEILLISQAIAELREEYKRYQGRYDEQLREFKYAFDLFLSIILNEQVGQDDEVVVPEPSAFIVTNGQTILNANNAFLLLANRTLDTIIGHSYTPFIPEVYRDIHKQWAADFIGKVEEYQGKAIRKCLSLGPIEIKLVQMEHRVLPRFMQGLQIFTIIRPVEGRKDRSDCFVFLVEKETFYIKNVEAGFFDALRFKVSQRNFKLLQEMSLTSIFQNFTLNATENPSREVTVFPHFLQEFTFTKSKRKTGKNKTTVAPTTRQSKLFSSTKVSADGDPAFEFSILSGTRPEDPYLKVQFTTREEKSDEPTSSQDSGVRIVQPQSQGTIQQKPKKIEKFSFFVPYHLLTILALCHIFYLMGRNSFDSAMVDLQRRYQFYLCYDSTTLSVLQAYGGVECTEELRVLWIQGYGDFSESFNALRRVDDAYFNQYFHSKVTVDFHNQLFTQIQKSITTALSSLKFYQAIILIILIVSMGAFVLDLLLSLRYTFFIQGKVGALLLQFVIIDSADVTDILSLIQSFQSNVLNIQESPLMAKVPTEVVEDSAFQLMKGGGYSLNNSMAICQNDNDNTPKELNRLPYGRRRHSSIGQHVSLSVMKEEFRLIERSAFNKKPVSRQQLLQEKNQNINLFKRRYRSCGFIMGANKKLFFFIFLGFIISATVISVSLIFLYAPFKYLPLHLSTLDRIQQSRIILLKSQTEILINSTSLQPSTSLSDTLLSLISLVSGVSTGPMTAFSNEFSSFLNGNSCGKVQFNCSLLSGDNGLHEYGIKVISQFLQGYYRLRNANALTLNILPNQVAIYTETLFARLAADFVSTSEEYCSSIDGAQVRMLILGSLGLLVGLLLTHYSLREFKDRIENSRNLLQIIPKEVQKKQEKEVEELTLKEISTP